MGIVGVVDLGPGAWHGEVVDKATGPQNEEAME